MIARLTVLRYLKALIVDPATSGSVVVAGTPVGYNDSLQVGDAQLLGVSSGTRHSGYTYDDRGRLAGFITAASASGLPPFAHAEPKSPGAASDRCPVQVAPVVFTASKKMKPLRPSWLTLCFFAACCAVEAGSCGADCSVIGENWEICAPAASLRHGSAHASLRERGRFGSSFVDSEIYRQQLLPGDCLFYGTTRGGRERYYIVCPGRTPALLADSEGAQWDISSERLVRHRTRLTDCNIVEETESITFAKGLVRAASEPQRADAWQSANEKSAVVPSVSQVIRPATAADPNNHNITPLIRAAGDNRLADVDRLLRCGADVNARDDRGYTALMNAASAAGADVVRRLIDAGADLRLRDFNGRDARWFADFNRDRGVAEALDHAAAGHR